MTITLVLMAGLMALFVGWLVSQSISVTPWVADAGPVRSSAATSMTSAKVGLFVFLAVVSSLFALFISAYHMRMHMGDWRPLPEPRILFVNTAILFLASVGLQWAWRSATHGDSLGIMRGLAAGGVGAVVFIAGQLLAWQQLVASGYFLTTNPANAFFYVLTAMHGLHLLGGLVAWSRTALKVWRGSDVQAVRLSVELCAIYWHFLLILWLVLFYLMLST